MTSTNPTRRIVRSIGAVFAGLLTTVIPTVATDAVKHATGIFPPPGELMANSLFLLATAYRVAYGIAGGYVAAWLALRRPMLHALILGIIGFAASVAGAVAMWNAGPGWYSLTIVAIAIPSTLLGGWLRS